MYRIYVCAELGIARVRDTRRRREPLHRIRGRAPQADPATYKSGQLKPEDAIGAGYTL
jgi:hypothetical protein